MDFNSLSVIVPVYNEAESLEELHREIDTGVAALGVDFEVIYVDDGSQDESWVRLLSLHERHPERVRLIRLKRNFGQTAALAAGFDAAVGDVIVSLDADLQNDPADIGSVLEALSEGYDLVSGWRAKRRDKLVTRRLPSLLANALISRITGVRLHDYGCTLKAYRRSVIESVNLYGEMHRFLPALAVWGGARVTEKKVNHRPRRHGKTKYGLDRTLRVLLDLITVRFLLAYSTRPMQVFGRWGLYAILSGIVSGMWMVFRKLFASEDITGTPWLYLSIFFILGGVQLIGMGLLGEINVRTYYETQKKPIYSVREYVARKEPGSGSWTS
ncbi:glycosyltransferase family 2 protein [bacterium]|nr:glycosyltransferase family 2 protein [bacterium]